MPRDDSIELTGRVLENLSHGFFKVKLENQHEVLCHLAGKLRKFSIKIVPGDSVTVELSPYDLTRGRIVYRH